MVYSKPIRLPGQFLQDQTKEKKSEYDFISKLRKFMSQLRPQIRRHGQRATFIFKDIRHKFSSAMMHLRELSNYPHHDGPYKVLSRGEKTYKVRIRRKPIQVTIDRLKPAYTLEDEARETNTKEQVDIKDKGEAQKVTKSRRTSKPPVCFAAT